MSYVIETKNLDRVYHLQGEDIHAINDVNLQIEQGKMTAIIGRSGAGKTTLLNLLSGLDTPTSGEVWIDGQSLYALSENKRVAFRRDNIGFVFQNFGLLPLLNALENVSIPLRMKGMGYKEIERQSREALEWVDLLKRANHRPYELSGGEQQRVAIARALAAKPAFLLADEPTGQLDSQTGRIVLNIMRGLVEERGITMVIVTHDPQVMAEADVTYQLKEGKISLLEATLE